MQISSAFDSGNIEVLSNTDREAQLSIPWDVGDEHRQWFHFRVTGIRATPLTLRMVDAGGCSYPSAWPDYRSVASYDRVTWFRVDTDYADGVLTIRHTPRADVVWYAYFAPYSWEQHQALIGRCAVSERVTAEVLGQTLDGRDMDLLTMGSGPRRIWVIARQHPGESMAEWWMDGFLARLLDKTDALAVRLLREATFYVVPNMNPDGSVRGHLRCNAGGANLNREWHEPTLERSPEVLLVRDHMDRTGVDLALDVHGDEELPYNFIQGADGIPGWTPRLAGLLERFQAAYVVANNHFQVGHGYPQAKPGQGNMTMATNQIGERFGCLSMTLEQPFKDTVETPDAVHGWSPDRAAALGASVLEPMATVINDLR
jgi:murein tripeptide amidase MpaA